MAVYRLMDGLSGRPGNGPAVATAFNGNALFGIGWWVTSPGMWLTGYWWWVCNSGQQVTPQKFALWQFTSASSDGFLIPGSVVTSGTLTAGRWNYVPLPNQVPLSIGTWYQATTGYASTTGFPELDNQFNPAQPYYNGITNGPLFAYGNSAIPGVAPGQAQVSSVAGADPSAHMALNTFNAANFFMDLQVSDQVPAGYAGSFRLWPNQPLPLNFQNDGPPQSTWTLGCEFKLSQACTLNKIWFYSQAGVTQLPTETGIYLVSSQLLVAGTHNAAPSWSGAAGSGWISVSYAGVTLPAGDYKVVVFNGGSIATPWSATTFPYWTSTGPGSAAGITTGPLSAPNLASATAPGQDTYHDGPSIHWPDTYSGNGQNYWVDVEVTALPVVGGAPDRHHHRTPAGRPGQARPGGRGGHR